MVIERQPARKALPFVTFPRRVLSMVAPTLRSVGPQTNARAEDYAELALRSLDTAHLPGDFYESADVSNKVARGGLGVCLRIWLLVELLLGADRLMPQESVHCLRIIAGR